jgi:hypothetical protein
MLLQSGFWRGIIMRSEKDENEKEDERWQETKYKHAG